jgi:hypothetical protein
MLRRMASWCLTSGSGSGSERYHDHDTGGSETFHVDTHLLNLCAIISPLLTATTIIFLGGFNIEHHCSVSLYANGGRSNNSTTFYYLPASSFRSWSSLYFSLISDGRCGWRRLADLWRAFKQNQCRKYRQTADSTFSNLCEYILDLAGRNSK